MIVHVISGLVRAPHASFGRGAAEPSVTEPTKSKAELPTHAQRICSLFVLDNEVAYCRFKRKAYDAERGAGRETGGPRATAVHAACRRGLGCRLRAGHGEERTANMPPMSVTLEVSKLSGWLNAVASCRESKEGHAMWGEVQTGRPEVAADRGARSVQGWARLQIGKSRARGGAHGEHVSKLSGWLNAHACCRESKEGHAMWGEVQTGRPEVAADRGARSVQGRGLDCRLGAGHGEERTANMPLMSVTLEVSRLSGWLNAVANCRESKEGRAMRGEVQTGRPEVAAGRGARSVQERPRLQIGRRARGGAHVEHAAHGCDAGGVEV
eukprot:scaffold26514_cov53-Phaeocystis_antarctica.AAC.5